MIDPSYVPVVTAVITSLTTVSLSIGGWVVATKNSKKTERDELRKMLDEHKSTQNQTITTISSSIDQKFTDIHSAISDLSADYQQYQALMELKFDNLTKQVEKHNNVIERTYALEKDMDVMKERSTVANHRITDLEHGLDKLQMMGKELV